jgi:hypothetical protein
MPSLRSKSGIISILVLASAICAAAISPSSTIPARPPISLRLAPPAVLSPDPARAAPDSVPNTPAAYSPDPARAAIDTVPGSPDSVPDTPAASSPHQKASSSGEFLNLKVLPKDIISKKLQGIMIDEFEDALGVGCGFCHGEQPNSHRPDYASDARPEKAIARAMMRMTINLNKKYFLVKKPAIGDPPW